MIYRCNKCEEIILDVEVLRFNTSNRPVTQTMEPKFCPFCGSDLNGQGIFEEKRRRTSGVS